MTKQDFFNFKQEKRKQLIYQAHLYYIGIRDISLVTDKETREFIEMCEREQELASRRNFMESLLQEEN